MVQSIHIDPERIEEAADLIDPVFLNAPQVTDAALNRRLRRDLLVKLEIFNPVRSFKGRGADYFMRELAPGREVVCASAGNFGQAIAYVGRARGVPVRVFTAAGANPTKIERMRELGAVVVPVGTDFDVAKDAAREHADTGGGRIFVEDGHEPRITEGAGTIGVEIASAKPDVALVPVGNGALVSGVGCWMKAHAPTTRIVGVCAAGAPAMAESWRAARPVSTESVQTIADGVAVRVPVPAAVEWMRRYVDDVVLVDDDQIREALRTVRDTLGLILEPAGVLGVAAAARPEFEGARLATIVTGSNFGPDLLAELVGG